MKIVLLTVGKTTAKNIVSGIEMYTERIRHYVPFELVSIPDLKSTAALSADQQKVREGQGIIAALNPGDRVVLLDERGEMLTSRKFAQRIQQRMSAGVKRLVFVVGGPYGFSEEVYARADARLSLSAMTFPHDLVRLLFIEQLYRAMTILKGEKYHHD
ncbi:23S rRNA (pseudouridine(1915)-N(3))-methyltransferase RlmH [Muribaculaceae bacterium Isolate-104 (HZI)]|jgi:23S rRNA (pseudouridine1915-N3)-methyltransferase|nr:23S rRNA (pseudouridine(1915)-N(3))-methyltransferase RlmH [Muribaculaceae bacterium Isolate-104 (HZI)]